MVKKKLGKNTENGDIMSWFWYTLKNLDPTKCETSNDKNETHLGIHISYENLWHLNVLPFHPYCS
jgi:hypothetical protein